MTTASVNGRVPRKQLADQLDRLDSIIDCLADALPGAVRDAVAESLTSAVKQLVADALADPAALALIRQTFAPAPTLAPVPEPVAAEVAPTAKPSFLERLRARVRPVLARARAACASARDGVRAKLSAVGLSVKRRLSSLKVAAGVARSAWQFRGVLGAAMLAGAAVAAGSCLSHTFAVLTAAAGAMVLSVAAQVAARLRPWAWGSGQ